MKNYLNIIILLILTTNCFSQSDLHKEIFDKIVEYEFRSGFAMIQCEKAKTIFDEKKLREKTENKIPKNIIQELNRQSTKSQTSEWSIKLFKNGCLNKKDLKVFYENKSEKNSVLLISEPIFDLNQEHCVISVEYLTYGGMNYGTSYFMKKNFGIWTIVTDFNTWMK